MGTPRELCIGDPAPAFALMSGDARPVTLEQFRGRKVILYFYPKDDTPGCTREACGFRDALGEFTGAGAVVLGVSRDDDASHRRFAAKYRLPFPLLSDPNAAVTKAYGVYKRTTFVIDAQGRIEKIFPRVKVDGHIQEVLEAIRETSDRHQAARSLQ